MTIDINNNRNGSSDGGKNGPCQKSKMTLLVEEVVKSAKAMSSFEAASALLLAIVPVILGDQAATDTFLRGREELIAFFENKNKPLPSTTIGGSNVIMGNAPSCQFTGYDSRMDVGVNSPGNQIIQSQINKPKSEEDDDE